MTASLRMATGPTHSERGKSPVRDDESLGAVRSPGQPCHRSVEDRPPNRVRAVDVECNRPGLHVGIQAGDQLASEMSTTAFTFGLTAARQGAAEIQSKSQSSIQPRSDTATTKYTKDGAVP